MDSQNDFDDIDITTIYSYIENKQEENLHLEFKRINKSEMTRADRKNFGKAISGFANSDGGIIIWGVEACSRQGEPDYACGVPGVDDVNLLLSKLNEFTGKLTSPTVDGVRHKAIITNDKNGFVVSFIPKSLHAPHMFNIENRYYKRSGDSTYAMEHFDIMDVLSRRTIPELSIRIDFEGINRPNLLLNITINNDGLTTANRIFLILHNNDQYPLNGYKIRGVEGIHLPDNDGQIRFGDNLLSYLHPGMSVTLPQLRIKTGLFAKTPTDIPVKYSLFAENMPVDSKTINVMIPPDR